MRSLPAMMPLAALMLVLAPACGDSSEDDGPFADDELGGDDQGVESTSPTESGGSGSSGSGGSEGTTSSGTTTGSTSSSTTESESSTEGGIKFDTPTPDTPGGGGCGMEGGDVEFSYIWIANSNQGTLTKLNTVTMIEEARYLARPDGAGRPSRTSVNLSGDVVVASRDGGVTKFYARIEDCVDQNGTPGIQTSAGKADVLTWATEECRAWHTDFPGTNTSRPVAWTAGTQNPQTCAFEDQKVWTQSASLAQGGSMEIHRLNGETGVIEDTVPAPGVDLGSWGAYGGAVDGEDNFWFSTHGSASPATLSRVNYDDLTLTTWPVPASVSPYGMTFDNQGHAWVAGYSGGVARFTVETETWDVVPETGLGMQADGEGRVWVGSYAGMGAGTFAIDVDTLEILDFIAMPDAGVTKGISIDFFGYVWVVNMGSNAYRIDPETHQMESYDGLDGAYTYSDMTGAGLKGVAFPPG